MNSLDIFTMAVRNLLKRKTRTLLTILGVVIGTASIVVMVSLALAMNKTFDEQLEQLGDITIVTVHNPESRYMGYEMGGQQSRKEKLVLDNNAILMFQNLTGVIAATPLVQTDFTLSIGKYAGYFITLIGIDPKAMPALGYATTEGRLLDENDRQNLVFGASVVENMRDPKKSYMYDSTPPEIDPMASTIKYSMDYMYYYQLAGYTDFFSDDSQMPKVLSTRCVGVLESKGYQADNSVYMAYDYVKKLKDDMERDRQQQNQSYGMGVSNQTKQMGYDIALVKCADLSAVKKVKAIIDEMGYPCEIPSQSLDSMEQIANSMQSLLASIGAVSLIVAALGITNTMITAIYERTREIGIMKVIGASLGDIRKLFLTEAALIGSLGGLIGVGLSVGISYFINTSGMQFFGSIREFSSQTVVSLITPELCGLGVLFATIMGVASGIMPAQRAMNLSALTAIKTE